MSVSIGLHDIIFENDANEGLRLDPKQLSFFAAVGSVKDFGEYTARTFMGFGTGGFSINPYPRPVKQFPGDWVINGR